MPIKTSIDLTTPVYMIDYEKRLDTFSNWESPVSKVDLARAGFFYSGVEDVVVCSECHLQLQGWEISDIPRKEHEAFNKGCLMLLKRVFCDVAWIKCETVKYPKFRTNRKRKNSFKNYLALRKTRRKLFVDAGFFYTGVQDAVVCYHCGLALKNWSSEENPQEIHVRFFPTCPVIRMMNTANILASNLRFKTNIESITSEEIAIIEKKLSLNSTVSLNASYLF